MPTHEQFIKKYGLQFDFQPDPERPANHYRVTITHPDGDTFKTRFHGPRKDPVLVMKALGTESYHYIEAEDYQEWCDFLVYDMDNPEHHDQYHEVMRQAGMLEEFLGTEVFEELMYDTNN